MDNYVITIARGFGSGGKTIGKMLSEKLGVSYYDKELIKVASEESGISESLFGISDEKVKKSIFKHKNKSDEISSPNSGNFTSEDNLFNFQAKVIRELADKESCIIIGRAADYVLRGRKNVVRVFVFADRYFCINKVLELFPVKDSAEASALIEKTDRERESYYKYHTGNEWDNARNYDLCLNSSQLGFEKCVDIISEYLKIRFS